MPLESHGEATHPESAACVKQFDFAALENRRAVVQQCEGNVRGTMPNAATAKPRQSLMALASYVLGCSRLALDPSDPHAAAPVWCVQCCTQAKRGAYLESRESSRVQSGNRRDTVARRKAPVPRTIASLLNLPTALCCMYLRLQPFTGIGGYEQGAPPRVHARGWCPVVSNTAWGLPTQSLIAIIQWS